MERLTLSGPAAWRQAERAKAPHASTSRASAAQRSFQAAPRTMGELAASNTAAAPIPEATSGYAYHDQVGQSLSMESATMKTNGKSSRASRHEKSLRRRARSRGNLRRTMRPAKVASSQGKTKK